MSQGYVMNYHKLSNIVYIFFVGLAFLLSKTMQAHDYFFEIFVVLTLGYLGILQQIVISKLDKIKEA